MPIIEIKDGKITTPREVYCTVDPNMKSHANDPVVLKKVEEAKAFLRKHGLPEGMGKVDF